MFHELNKGKKKEADSFILRQFISSFDDEHLKHVHYLIFHDLFLKGKNLASD